ncbi:MAG: hypothetical protein GY720_07370 [bacterium]|nr:hypothetical protein [bacterium]
MKRSINWMSLLAALVLVAAACGGTSDADQASTTTAPTTTAAPADDDMSDDDMSDEEMSDDDMSGEEMRGHTISFETAGWPEFAGGAHYEGWLIIDSTPVSTGRFNVVDGAIVDLDGAAVDHFSVEADTSAATAVVITIEPANDSDPAPSDTHILAGDLVDGAANLTISHAAALGTDFAAASGEFVLATPTDGDHTNDEFSGVWFLTFPGPTPGLVLPELPDGWIYEGWTVIDGTPVTTGTFLAVDRSDDAAPYSGTVRTPNFPGEDFLQNAPEGMTFPTNLSGATVVISIEPLTEDNPLPFALKPLVGPVPADAELEPVSYPLSNADFTALTGTATIG